MKKLLFAATETGVGKTTLVTGLIALWVRQGWRVQPYKVGPDYIDPSFHTLAAGRASRNLDTWLVPKKKVAALFVARSAAADLSVIEGMMGLYDGFSPTNEAGSTAEVAKLLRAPVILVVNGEKLARSAAAIVKGYQKLDPKVRLAGVIFNRVAGDGHYEILRRAVEKECRVPCLGYLPPDPKLDLPEQHLGLVPAESTDGKLRPWLNHLVAVVEKKIDHAKLLRIAGSRRDYVARTRERSTRIPRGGSGPLLPNFSSCRIAYAKDEAFHFYYPDNIELLEELGAEMVPFSPLRDRRLPEVDALYFGGGFPENYAAKLAANQKMMREIREAVRNGMPTYAECGGLMYLVRKLRQKNGKGHKMVGAIPGIIQMTDQLQHFGYSFVEAAGDSVLFRRGEKARGHEFHYSTWKFPRNGAKGAYRVSKRKGSAAREEGVAAKNLLASYVHIHFLSCPKSAARFVQKAAQFNRKQK